MLVENAAAEPAAGGLTRLARLAVRRRGRIVVAWVVLLAAVVALAPALGGEWTNDYSTAGSESKAAADRLAERFPGQSPDSVDVVWRADDARDPQVLAQVQSVVGGAAALPGIGDAPARDAFAISEDGRTGLARIPVS